MNIKSLYKCVLNRHALSIGYETKFLMMALFVVIATCISVIEFGSNQSQIAMAQQQSQVNQTPPVLTTAALSIRHIL